MVTIETCTILLYLFIAVLITVNLGNMLYKKGAILLHHIFYQEEEWAKPVNKIMLSGFYLLNIGIATLYYNQGIDLESYLEAFNFLSSKIGGLLVIVGGMHIFNVLFFLLIKWDYLTMKPKI
jgi:hypothetical protein